MFSQLCQARPQTQPSPNPVKPSQTQFPISSKGTGAGTCFDFWFKDLIFRCRHKARQLQPRAHHSWCWPHWWGEWPQAPGAKWAQWPWSPHTGVRTQPPGLVLCPALRERVQPRGLPPAVVGELLRASAPGHHLSQVLPLLHTGPGINNEWPRSRAWTQLWLEKLCSLRRDSASSVCDQELAPRHFLESEWSPGD